MVVLARSPRPQPPRSDADSFKTDVLAGLRAPQKHIPAKYFYDELGSQLFERITEQPEYYPTRCEMSILRDRAGEIARLITPGSAIVEFGSGSNKKARLLLQAAPALAAYVPVDISGEMLEREAADLRADFPELKVLPVAADFTTGFDLPDEAQDAPRRIGFFPGSTIGNFEPPDAVEFLRNAGRILGRDGVLIVGADLVKPAEILNAAYDDAAGVTADFNLNLLTRINRELGGTFDREGFAHRAFFNEARSRIEMHLVSRRPQTVKVGSQAFAFRDGETIHTENSYKYSVESFAALARKVGWRPAGVWTDPAGYFSIQAFRLAP